MADSKKLNKEEFKNPKVKTESLTFMKREPDKTNFYSNDSENFTTMKKKQK